MNKNMKKFIAHYLLIPVLVLLSAGVWSFANAASYHVRKDGNDTTASAPSASAPKCAFLKVQNDLKMAQAVDTNSIHAGDYSTAKLSSIILGTAVARITILAVASSLPAIEPHGSPVGMSVIMRFPANTWLPVKSCADVSVGTRLIDFTVGMA